MIAATFDLAAAAGRRWDVAVLGAGPAGSLAARQLAVAGAGVLLVDRKAFPRDKVCGACLNGKALAVLDAVGLGGLVDRLGGIDLDAFELRLAGRRQRFALPAGKALGRDRLDAALIEEAIAAGAHFLPETSARIEVGEEETRAVRLTQHGHAATTEAAVVLVASGLAGHCLDDEPGVRTRIAARSRIGAGCTLREFPASYGPGTIHMAVGRHGYVGLVRVADGGLNVAAAFDVGFVREQGSPARAAVAVLDEAGFDPISALDEARWQGTPSLTRRTRPVGGHRLFLLGDAAGYVEPFTGEGMAAAFTSAQAVVPLALRGARDWEPGLARAWSRLHHRLIGRRQHICRGLAATARHPWVARGLFAVVSYAPSLSRRMIQRLNAPPPHFEAT
jgi:flavin-dependent dehydrogenase